jgi:hypothetical protein
MVTQSFDVIDFNNAVFFCVNLMSSLCEKNCFITCVCAYVKSERCRAKLYHQAMTLILY